VAPKRPQELQLATDIPVAVQSVVVGDLTIPLMVADCDVVMQMYIDAGQGDRDPYWTCPWPSSIALAQELLQRPELVRGLRVADLGCGLGLAGVAAALAGASEVVFLDREPLALQCAISNAALNGASVQGYVEVAVEHDKQLPKMNTEITSGISKCTIHSEVFDWNDPASLEPFDVVLACDVLYEKFSVEPLSRLAPALLSTPGRLLLADPPTRAKHNRERFVELVSDSCLLTEQCGERHARVWEEGKNAFSTVPITLMIMRRGCSGDTVGVKLR